MHTPVYVSFTCETGWTNACVQKRRMYVCSLQIGEQGLSLNHMHLQYMHTQRHIHKQIRFTRVWVEIQTDRHINSRRLRRGNGLKTCTHRILRMVCAFLSVFLCVHEQNKWDPAAWTVTVATWILDILCVFFSLRFTSIHYDHILTRSLEHIHAYAHIRACIVRARCYSFCLYTHCCRLPGRLFYFLFCLFVCSLVHRFLFIVSFLLSGYACRSHVDTHTHVRCMYVISSNHAALLLLLLLYVCCMFLGNEISRNRSMHWTNVV